MYKHYAKEGNWRGGMLKREKLGTYKDEEGRDELWMGV